MSTRGSFTQGTVSDDIQTLGESVGMLMLGTDAPADTMESDSKFTSGEKPMLSRDSPANR